MESQEKKKRTLFAIAAVAAVAGSLFFFLSRRGDDGAIRTSGIVEGIETNISAKISGRITEICCSEGGDIAAGQVAVRLESEEIEANVRQAAAAVSRAASQEAAVQAAVKSAEAAVRLAAAETRSAAAEESRLRTQAEDSARTAGRAGALASQGFISREELDRANAARDASLAAVAAARARVEAAEAREVSSRAQATAASAELKAAEAGREEAVAQRAATVARRNDATIPSPVTGTVIFRSVELGEYTAPGQAILTVVDLRQLFVRIDLEETHIAGVQLQKPAIVRIPSMADKRFEARIAEINRHAEFATQRDVTRGRQDIRTFRVKVAVPDPEGLLKPGMTVLVEIPPSR